MPAICAKMLQGPVARATLLDTCGVPVVGACSTVTTDGWVQAQLTPNVEAPDEFKQKNAAGNFLVNQRSRPLLNWMELQIDFVEVDPELFGMITGLPVIRNDAAIPEAVGFQITESAFATANFALELWMGTAEGPCEPGEEVLYGYQLLPWVVEGAIGGEITVTNDLITFSVTGRTRSGTPWGVGPYDVINTDLGAASPLLVAIPDDTHDHIQWTTLAPPAASCGCVALAA